MVQIGVNKSLGVLYRKPVKKGCYLNQKTKYMKHLTLAIATLSIGLVFTSCKKEIKGSGHYVTQTRTIANFDKVSSSGDFTVILVEDSISRIELNGEDNILPEIETKVTGNELGIYFDNYHYSYDHAGVTITVYNPSFKGINLSGSGKISNDNILKSGNLDVNLSGSGEIDLILNNSLLTSTISGSGNIDLQGETSHAIHTISGSGNLNAYNMVSTDASTTISGSGTCRVNVLNQLNVAISGSGSVFYIGNPNIITNISGSGHVRPE